MRLVKGCSAAYFAGRWRPQVGILNERPLPDSRIDR